jgi:hypothetical protein
MKASDLAKDLEKERARRLRGEWSVYPRNNPIASDLHDCPRYHVLTLVAWDQKETPDVTGLTLIRNGRESEDAEIQALLADGFKVTQTQRPFEIRSKDNKRMILRGRSEGLIHASDGTKIGFEIKDTSWFNFQRLNTEADLMQDVWTRKWWRQMQAYMIGHNEEECLLILRHRGQRKFIVVKLDWDEAHKILDWCERSLALADELASRRFTQDEKIPSIDEELNNRGIEYYSERKVCQSCPFFQRSCAPQVTWTDNKSLVLRPDLELEVTRHQELEPAAKEHASLDKKLKKAGRGNTLVCGRWLLTGQWSEQKLQAQPAKPASKREIWKQEIVELPASTEKK